MRIEKETNEKDSKNDTSNIDDLKPSYWTPEEDKTLLEKAVIYNFKNWNSVAEFLPNRTAVQCSARYKRIRPGLVKGSWSKEEDEELMKLYEQYGKNWAVISKNMSHRTGKQIRDRFLNILDDSIDRTKFKQEEDDLIIKYYKMYGNCWSKIAKKLKNRTGDMVKNRFYSSLKSIVKYQKGFLCKKRKKSKGKKETQVRFDIINEKERLEEESDKKLIQIQKSNQIEHESVEENKRNISSTDNNLMESSIPSFKFTISSSEQLTSHGSYNKNNINSKNLFTIKSSFFNSFQISKISVNIISEKNKKNNNRFTVVKNIKYNNQSQIMSEENTKKSFKDIVNTKNENFLFQREFEKPLIKAYNPFELCKYNKNYNRVNEMDRKIDSLINYTNNQSTNVELKVNLESQLDILIDLQTIINKKIKDLNEQIK